MKNWKTLLLLVLTAIVGWLGYEEATESPPDITMQQHFEIPDGLENATEYDTHTHVVIEDSGPDENRLLTDDPSQRYQYKILARFNVATNDPVTIPGGPSGTSKGMEYFTHSYILEINIKPEKLNFDILKNYAPEPIEGAELSQVHDIEVIRSP